MSIKVMSWVWEHSASRGNDRLVLLAIADVAGDDGDCSAYPRSLSFLAKKTNLSRSTVQERIKSLVALGELVVEAGDGRDSSNYKVQMRVPDSGPLESEGTDQPVPRGPDPGTQGTDGPVPHHSVLVRPSPSPPVEESAPPTERVFAAWTESTGHTRAKLDDKRRRLISKAIASHGLDDVLAAVVGWRHSPHHRGENDRATVYNDIGLLLRDAAQIEKFRDYELDARLGASITSRATPIRRDAVAERNRQREDGTACATCAGDLWLQRSDGAVEPCPDCSPLAVAR